MLVTSIFSVSHNVSYSFKKQTLIFESHLVLNLQKLMISVWTCLKLCHFTKRNVLLNNLDFLFSSLELEVLDQSELSWSCCVRHPLCVIRHQLFTWRTLYRPHFLSELMKLDENVCLDEVWDEFENGSYGGQKLGHLVKSWKKLVYALEVTFSV